MKRTVASLKTSALSVGIGAVFSLGVHCVFSFLSCYFDSNPGKHPIRYPASIGTGMICLMIFLVLVYLYAKVRKKSMSTLGIALDVVFGMTSCIPFYFLWVTADNMISGLV